MDLRSVGQDMQAGAHRLQVSADALEHASRVVRDMANDAAEGSGHEDVRAGATAFGEYHTVVLRSLAWATQQLGDELVRFDAVMGTVDAELSGGR